MVRVDHYSHHDDPFNYFQRLQSYSSSKPSFSQPSSLAQWSSSILSGRSDSQPESSLPYSDTNPSHVSRSAHSRTESSSSLWPRRYRDSASESEKSRRSLRSEYLRQHDGRADEAKRAWSKKRKIIFAAVIIGLVVLGIIIGVAVHLKETAYSYTPITTHVTNSTAFQTGGATYKSVDDVQDGIGKGQDVYTYYTGDAANFPSSSRWVSFEDMWTANLPGIQTACSNLGYGADNTASETQDIYTAIQDRANASYVDHRYILAVILQESHGCVHVEPTTSSGGVSNRGLMQSYEGHSFSSFRPSLSILAMVQDGTQGTSAGPGLVQNLNLYGDPYKAARGYNSGYVPKDGNLSAASGATACYVSDIANRLTGWTDAKSTCPGDDD